MTRSRRMSVAIRVVLAPLSDSFEQTYLNSAARSEVLNFRARIEAEEYSAGMGILLLIVAAFAIMGGLQVVLYSALGCAVLLLLFVLPSMAIGKVFRL